MSQASSAHPEITRTYVEKAVRRIGEVFETSYVDEAVGARMREHLEARLADGAFSTCDSLPCFAGDVTRELHAVRNDKHLAVLVRAPDGDKPSCNCPVEDSFYHAHTLENYGFRRVEMLPGAIGYLDLRIFCPPSMAGDTAIAAMNFLANTNAIIFDLRHNGGGEDGMVRLLASYLFDESVELCSIHHRGERGLEQSKTLDYVPGPRLSNVPAYVLTSSTTFSAAEDFTYNLQQLGRVTVVGEQTRGGGHTIEFIKLPEFQLELAVPEGRAVNPISGGGWEETGITPDIPTSARDALLTAQVHALERLKQTLSDPAALDRVNWALLKSHAELEPVSISEETLATYAGHYVRSNRVTLRDGTLFVHHAGFPESPCTPLAQDLFEYEGDGARVHFLKEGNRVTEAVFQLESGQEFRCPRTSEPE